MTNMVQTISLLSPLSSARLYDYGVHFHCNFTAVKLRKDGSRAAQPKALLANFIYLKSGLRDILSTLILLHCHRRAGMYNVLKLSSPEHFEAVPLQLQAQLEIPDNSDDGSIKLFFGDVLKSFSFSDGEFCIWNLLKVWMITVQFADRGLYFILAIVKVHPLLVVQCDTM
ncbi:Glutamate-1-semialdehyde 2 1-aminomutase [Bienertia sinuspersici]